MQYRADKMAKGMKATSINRNQSRLSSVFSALIRAEEFHNQHPFKDMGKLKQRVTEMGFLTTSEITQLLEHLSGDEFGIAKLCLSTGARWSEAAELRGSNIVHVYLMVPILYFVTYLKNKSSTYRKVRFHMFYGTHLRVIL